MKSSSNFPIASPRKCETAVGSLKLHLASERTSADSIVAPTMNVIFTIMDIIDYNRDASVWREIVVRSLNHFAGSQVEVVDAFRPCHLSTGKKRPILVKVTSA